MGFMTVDTILPETLVWQTQTYAYCFFCNKIKKQTYIIYNKVTHSITQSHIITLKLMNTIKSNIDTSMLN